MKICLGIHSFDELKAIVSAITSIPDVEEVKTQTLG